MRFHYEIDKIIQIALEIEGLGKAIEPSKKGSGGPLDRQKK